MLLSKRLKWLLLAILLSAVPSVAQSAREFQQKYGLPDDKGNYMVRPGIAVKPSFAEDGQLCKILIEPQSSSMSSVSAAPLMDLEVVAKIISEFAPEVRRTQRRPALTMGTGCTSIEEYHYKQVVVYRTVVCRAEGDRGVKTAEIHWRSRKCK